MLSQATRNLLQRPRDVPVRTLLGAMAIAFYVVLTVASGDDLIALKFSISLNAITWALRIGMLLLPPLVYVITYRFCIGLQRSDREVLKHGVETGIIRRDAYGEFIEMHQPLGGVDAHGHAIALDYQGAPLPKKMNTLGAAGSAARGSLFRPDPPSRSRRSTRRSTRRTARRRGPCPAFRTRASRASQATNPRREPPLPRPSVPRGLLLALGERCDPLSATHHRAPCGGGEENRADDLTEARPRRGAVGAAPASRAGGDGCPARRAGGGGARRGHRVVAAATGHRGAAVAGGG